jgi:hypothetical protein
MRLATAFLDLLVDVNLDVVVDFDGDGNGDATCKR